MYTAISIVIVIVSAVLTLVVLVQNSKGGGLAANFAGGNQAFGVRKAADLLEKITWSCASAIIVLCVFATLFIDRGAASKDELRERIENTSTSGQPTFPTLPTQEIPSNNTPAE